ncbi:MAG: DUF5117 domain-containing protein, partial [Planctomycetota bacterium]
MRVAPIVLVLCAAGLAGEGPEGKPPDPIAEARKKAEELLKDSETQKGFFTLHLKEGKVHAELGKEDFDRQFLCFESVSRGVGRGWALGGMTLGTRLVSFRRVSNVEVHLVEHNPRFRAAPGTPMERAVRLSYGPSVLASFPVAARHPDRDTLIVDLGALFLTDLPGLADSLQKTFDTAYKHEKGSSSWAKAKSYPKNAELEVNLVFSSSSLEDAETVPDARSIEIGVHYSLHPLPDPGYRPREADDRVGYFLTVVKDFSRPGVTSWARYVNRWRVEKADPAAGMSAPKDPLVFWIENSVPHEFRRYVRDGILEWNKAFEKLAIRDAIEVRQMEEDADWDPEDARYNTFRWIASSRQTFGAIGPSRADPRTGQLLDADILYEAENLRGLLFG